MVSNVNTKIAVLETKINDIHRTLCGGEQPGLMQKIDSHLISYNDFLKDDANWKGKYEGSAKMMKIVYGSAGTILTCIIGLVAYFK